MIICEFSGTTNEMLSFYQGADGVKTGFTGNAGRCLVASATRNGRQLISVALGCGNKKQRTEDSVKLLNYGFDYYEVIDICENMRKEFHIQVEKGKADNYKIILEGSIKMPILKSKIDKITYEYEMKEKLEAPISVNQEIGKITFFVDGEKIRELPIYLPKSIEKKGLWDYFKKISSLETKNYEIRL